MDIDTSVPLLWEKSVVEMVIRRCSVLEGGVGVGRRGGRGECSRGVVECIQCASPLPSCLVACQLAHQDSLFTSFLPNESMLPVNCFLFDLPLLEPHGKDLASEGAEDVKEPQPAIGFRDVRSSASVRDEWCLSGEGRLRQGSGEELQESGARVMRRPQPCLVVFSSRAEELEARFRWGRTTVARLFSGRRWTDEVFGFLVCVRVWFLCFPERGCAGPSSPFLTKGARRSSHASQVSRGCKFSLPLFARLMAFDCAAVSDFDSERSRDSLQTAVWRTRWFGFHKLSFDDGPSCPLPSSSGSLCLSVQLFHLPREGFVLLFDSLSFLLACFLSFTKFWQIGSPSCSLFHCSLPLGQECFVAVHLLTVGTLGEQISGCLLRDLDDVPPFVICHRGVWRVTFPCDLIDFLDELLLVGRESTRISRRQS